MDGQIRVHEGGRGNESRRKMALREWKRGEGRGGGGDVRVCVWGVSGGGGLAREDDL